MLMKTYRILLVLLGVVSSTMLWSQTDFYNNGMEMTILEGTSLTIKGNYYHDSSSTDAADIASAGEVRIEYDLINNTDNGVFSTTAGRVEFFGEDLQTIVSDTLINFNTVEVNKPSEELWLTSNIEVLDSLILTSGNVYLNTNDIDLDQSGRLVGEEDNKRVYGKLGFIHAYPFLSTSETNISGLGLSIETSSPIGKAQVYRANASQAGASNGAVERYYVIEPDDVGYDLNNVGMRYLDTTEMNGLDETKFSMWISDNDGLVWHRQTSIPYTGVDSVSATNVPFDGNTITITVAESDCDSVPEVDLGEDTVYLCAGDSLEIDAENPGLFFDWNTGEITQTIFIETAGNYFVTVTDANGCVGLDSIDVILKPYPVAGFDLDYVCQNDTSYFTNESTISEDTMTFFWDFGVNTLVSDTSIEANPYYVYDTSGSYTVTLTIESDFGCVHDTTMLTIIHPNPKAGFLSNAVCIDSLTEFSNTSTISSGGMLYSWDFGDPLLPSDTSDLTNPTYTYDTSGVYTTELVVRSNAGCYDTAYRDITVYPRPIPDFTFAEVGENESIELVNTSTIESGTMTYQWDFGDGVETGVDEPTKTYTSYGEYTISLEATSEYACWDTLSQIITISDFPTPAFSVNDTCQYLGITIDNQSSVNDGTSLSYEWSFGDGSTSTDEIPSKSYDTEGEYTIWLKVTSSEGNVDSTSQTITIHPKPVVDFNYSNECVNDQVSFVNQSFVTSGFNQYTWDFGDGESSTLGSPNYTYDTEGDFEVELLALSNQGCTDTLSQFITIYALPILDFGDEITTCGDSIVLDAKNDGASYLWNTSATDQLITAKSSGTYFVTVTSPEDCEHTETVDVALNSLFSPNLGDDRDACVSTLLDAGNPGSTYEWNTGDDSRTITVTTSGEYTVDIIDQNGCEGADTINIVINQLPIVDLGNDTTVCSGESVILNAENDGASYDWTTGAISQTIEVSVSGTYGVVVQDENGCEASSSVTLGLFSLPVVNLGDDQAVCQSTTLFANNSGASYLWSDGSDADSLFVESAGTYWVEVTNGNDCISYDTATISILEKPVVELGEDRIACNDGVVELDAGTEADTYTWNTGATSQLLFASNTGTYSVTVENDAGCLSSDEVSVTILDKVTVDLGQNMILCANSEFTLDAGNSGSSYAWGTTADTTFGDVQEITLNEEGTYWVQVTTDDDCIGTDTIQIDATTQSVEAQFLAVSLVDVGDTIQFLELATPDSLGYIWDFADGVVSIEQDPQHIYYVAGIYNVSLTVFNELCSDEIVKAIVVNELKQVEPEIPLQSYFEIEEFVIYPNPTSGDEDLNYKLELSEEANVDISLFDISGKLVSHNTLLGDSFEGKFSMYGLPNGIYFIRLIMKGEIYVVKVVKA